MLVCIVFFQTMITRYTLQHNKYCIVFYVTIIDFHCALCHHVTSICFHCALRYYVAIVFIVYFVLTCNDIVPYLQYIHIAFVSRNICFDIWFMLNWTFVFISFYYRYQIKDSRATPSPLDTAGWNSNTMTGSQQPTWVPNSTRLASRHYRCRVISVSNHDRRTDGRTDVT